MMHRTKTAARAVAWGDRSNPFSKSGHVRRNGTMNSQELAERGLNNPQTDDPDYRLGQGAQYEMSGSQQTSTDHNDETGISRSRFPNGHDDKQIITLSPTESIRDAPSSTDTKVEKSPVNEKSNHELHTARTKTDTDMENNTDEKKAGFFSKMFGGKGKDKSEATRSNSADKDGKPKKKFTFKSQLNATLFNSWINILLIASPVGIATYYAGVNKIAVFVINFIAIIPLAALLSYATEEIALRTGEVIGGLLNASFGNAVELIVSIIALAQDQVLIVQTSLIGSMLSNLLLVMGMCFFAGGVTRIEQAFNMTVAQTASSLLFLAVSALIIPTAFGIYANTGTTNLTEASAANLYGVAELSRATSILLLVVYACYLFFQLKSHTAMYNAPSEKNEKRDMTNAKNKIKSLVPGKRRKRSVVSNQSQTEEEGKDEPPEPELHLWVAIGTLAFATVLVALNAEYLVDSINYITCTGHVSKNFIGLILLPIVGNAAEHATAVTVAIKDKMDLAIGVAVGSSMQIALLVLPLVVVLGWIIGKNDMTLYFDGFQIAVLFVAVLLVNYLIQDGKSHWLEGVLLMTLYVIIAIAAWYYPTAPGLNDCGST